MEWTKNPKQTNERTNKENNHLHPSVLINIASIILKSQGTKKNTMTVVIFIYARESLKKLSILLDKIVSIHQYLHNKYITIDT